ncbi:unnamed protein product, partial [Phaeothamnion confervicola]
NKEKEKWPVDTSFRRQVEGSAQTEGWGSKNLPTIACDGVSMTASESDRVSSNRTADGEDATGAPAAPAAASSGGGGEAGNGSSECSYRDRQRAAPPASNAGKGGGAAAAAAAAGGTGSRRLPPPPPSPALAPAERRLTRAQAIAAESSG